MEIYKAVESDWHNVYVLKIYNRLLFSLVPCIVSHQAQKSKIVTLVLLKGR